MENTTDNDTPETPAVTDQSVVALTWVMKDSMGDLLDELEDPVEFLVGGDDLLNSIDQALIGRHVGDTVKLDLEPLDAFGDYDENLIFLEARTLFPAETEEGMTFDGQGLPAGCSPDIPQDALYIVTDLYPDHVVLDGNLPLAGISLHLQLRIHGVREATVDEIGRGSAGAGFFKLEAGAELLPGNDTLH